MSRLMIVGESPSSTRPPGKEDIPFSGRTSAFLWNELSAYGITRENCLITNIVEEQCLKGELKDKVEENLPRLRKLVETWKPDVILSFGRFATESLLGRKLRSGLLAEVGHQKSFMSYPLFPCVHPGALSRNPSLKDAFERGIYHAIKLTMEQRNETNDARRNNREQEI